MSETPTAGPKPKKSVALSGVAAGNTALCTVGRTGNDLHYSLRKSGRSTENRSWISSLGWWRAKRPHIPRA